jgi:hypothetical protein
MTYPQALRREVTVDGLTYRLSPMCHRLLLILLLRGPNRVTTNADLIEALWPDPDTQPEATRENIHAYVMRLRRLGVPIETLGRVGLRLATDLKGRLSAGLDDLGRKPRRRRIERYPCRIDSIGFRVIDHAHRDPDPVQRRVDKAGNRL